LLLAGVAALACAPWLGACSASIEAPSRVEGLRVINVVADEPYAQPGDTVTFTMTTGVTGAPADTPLEILWLGGCFDPADDQYYACYASFQALLDAYMSGENPLATGLVGLGSTFALTLPDTIITDHVANATGEQYGLGYVFFAACAGKLAPAPATTDTGAGGGLAFPLGCFDADGNQLGADAFVPGFTQVYAFADGRTNANPLASGLQVKLDTDGDEAYEPLPADAPSAYPVTLCNIDEEQRRELGCGNDPFQKCAPYTLMIDVDATISELDPDLDSNGNEEQEAVWVDWYVSDGDLDQDVTLLYDPTSGLNPSPTVAFLPPPVSEVVTIWAAVHDSRGGGSVLTGYVIAENSAENIGNARVPYPVSDGGASDAGDGGGGGPATDAGGS
jgi:hypothetical protein